MLTPAGLDVQIFVNPKEAKGECAVEGYPSVLPSYEGKLQTAPAAAHHAS